ncbi:MULTISPECIES: HAD hydrolase-like protein [Bacillus]|nr:MULTISPECIES: HAD hydrolase-like protein [Bacillus]MCI4250631.1 HAD hydrolase-like protein [Bacillus sp. CCB-MMP212]MDA1664944.1 HAD hydrolase-like protein [Bacillus cereus]MDA1766294.1 HAD hydrolase-like protein [Bacillus cereus]MEC2866731.1 HAD hydrolase-like protein [Bacillus cereus]
MPFFFINISINIKTGRDCQKPNIDLLLKAAKEHNLWLRDYFLIGDTGSTDMIAAERANMKKDFGTKRMGRKLINKV